MQKKITHDFVEVYKDEAGEYRWRRKSRNGKILSDSGEGYKRRSDCLKQAIRCNRDQELIRFPNGSTRPGEQWTYHIV